MEEQRAAIIKQCLEPAAHERLNRVRLVKPAQASMAEKLIIQLFQATRTPISQDQLVEILEQTAAKGVGKVAFKRKKRFDSSDDNDSDDDKF